MALRSRSVMLYGFAVTALNQWIDFKSTSLGPQLSAKIDVGFYSLSGLMRAIKAAMESVDLLNTYTVTADRSINGGTENRVTIATSGSFLSLLFLTGTHHAASLNGLIGFASLDRTGATTYTGTLSAGTVIVSQRSGYGYSAPNQTKKVFGNVNVSASGLKEAVVWQIQDFLRVMFKFEPEDKSDAEWTPWFVWAIQQRPYDFTPEITSPEVFFEVTLDKTPQDGSGLAFEMSEMIPEFPFLYQTGALTMRLVNL